MKIRLFINHPIKSGWRVLLTTEQSHYLKSVMRVSLSERLFIFNGKDGEWEAEIIALGKKDGEVLPIKQSRKQLDTPDVWLLFAPIKHGKIDFLASKATE